MQMVRPIPRRMILSSFRDFARGREEDSRQAVDSRRGDVTLKIVLLQGGSLELESRAAPEYRTLHPPLNSFRDVPVVQPRDDHPRKTGVPLVNFSR